MCRLPAQVVAEWELFLLTSVGYSAGVRRQARQRLWDIQARDAAVLGELHARVQRALDGPIIVPTPTPLPTPRPALPPAGVRAALLAMVYAPLWCAGCMHYCMPRVTGCAIARDSCRPTRRARKRTRAGPWFPVFPAAR
jgi:hypothetical protein